MIYRFSQWRTSVVVTLRQKKKKKKKHKWQAMKFAKRVLRCEIESSNFPDRNELICIPYE